MHAQMHRAARIGLAFCAASTVGAVMLLGSASAAAAAGSFTYTGGDGKARTSSSPPTGRCVPLVGSGPVKNMTDSQLSLYNAPDCELRNRIAKVDAGKSKAEVPTFQAVYWDD